MTAATKARARLLRDLGRRPMSAAPILLIYGDLTGFALRGRGGDGWAGVGEEASRLMARWAHG